MNGKVNTISFKANDRMVEKIDEIQSFMGAKYRSEAIEVALNIIHAYYLYDDAPIRLKDEYEMYNFTDGRKERWKNKHA